MPPRQPGLHILCSQPNSKLQQELLFSLELGYLSLQLGYPRSQEFLNVSKVAHVPKFTPSPMGDARLDFWAPPWAMKTSGPLYGGFGVSGALLAVLSPLLRRTLTPSSPSTSATATAHIHISGKAVTSRLERTDLVSDFAAPTYLQGREAGAGRCGSSFRTPAGGGAGDPSQPLPEGRHLDLSDTLWAEKKASGDARVGWPNFLSRSGAASGWGRKTPCVDGIRD